jgi:hypothetical protein
MFPISAGAKQEREGASVLLVPTVFVLSLSLGLILFLSLFPEFVLRTVFGPGFHAAAHGMESLLSLNAAASAAYALSVVLMAYEMSRKIANTGWVQLAFSGVIILGLYFWHESLWQVVMVQLLLRVLLLLTVLLPFFWARRIPALQEAA